MSRLGTLGANARADPIQFLAQEPLPATFGLLGDLLADGFGFQVGRVIARVREAPAIRQLDDARGDDIQEIAVMRDEDDGAGKLRRNSSSHRMDSASRWLVGSSSSNRSG